MADNPPSAAREQLAAPKPVEWAMLATLSALDRENLLAAMRRRRISRRDVLCHEGDPGEVLYLIRSGRVAVRVTNEHGDTVTVATKGAGETVGELALIGDVGERTATVVALEPTEVLVLARRDLAALRSRHPGVDRFLVEMLAAQVRRLNGQVLEALYVPVRHRIARRLLELADAYATSGTTRTVLPITQDDLAGLAGASRPTVNQVLQVLEADGALRLERGRIEIADLEILKRRRG